MRFSSRDHTFFDSVQRRDILSGTRLGRPFKNKAIGKSFLSFWLGLDRFYFIILYLKEPLKLVNTCQIADVSAHISSHCRQ